MAGTWNKLRPIVLAVGLHAALLAILLLGLLQQDAPRTAHAPTVAVDATVMTAPPDVLAAEQAVEASTKPSSQPTGSLARHQSSASADSSPSARAQSNPHDAGARNIAKTPQEPSVRNNEASRQEQSPKDALTQQAVESDQSVTSHSDDDPFAEMRRERAEAELRYRLTTRPNTQDQPTRPTRLGSASESIPQNLDPALSPQDFFNAESIALWPSIDIDRAPTLASTSKSCSGFDDPSREVDENSDEAFDCLLGFPAQDSTNPFVRNAMSIIGPAPDSTRWLTFDFCHFHHDCDD